VVVLLSGEVVESAPTGELFGRPLHPYTRWLLAAAEGAMGGAAPATRGSGEPSAAGCRYAHHCGLAQPDCLRQPPPLEAIGPRHALRCPVVRDRERAVASPREPGNG